MFTKQQKQQHWRRSIQSEDSAITVFSSQRLDESIKKEEKQSTCFSKSARLSLSLLAFLISTGVDTAQFEAGLNDLNFTKPLAYTLTGLYLLQASALNTIYTSESIHEISRLLEGKKVSEWGKLTTGEQCKAYFASTTVLLYAIFADALIMAYYMEQLQWGLSTPLCILIGTLASFSNVSEPYETLKFFRSYFSKSHYAYVAALETIHQDKFYLNAPLTFQKNFNKLMEKFSSDIKVALLDSDNVAYVIKNKLDLGKKLLEIFENPDKVQIKKQLNGLKLKSEIAKNFSKRLSTLLLTRKEEPEEKTHFKNCVDKFGKGLDYTVKPFLKLCGFTEEIIEAYTVMAAISEQSLGNTSQELHVSLAIASGANGITDLVFNGDIICDGIDKLIAAIKTSDYTRVEMMIFLFSFTCATIVAYAQKGLIEVMLNDPEADYPAPLPPKFSKEVNEVLAYGPALRELALYTSFFYDSFSKIFRIIKTKLDAVEKNEKETATDSVENYAENSAEEKEISSTSASTQNSQEPLLPRHKKEQETQGCFSRCYARLFSSASSIDPPFEVPSSYASSQHQTR